MTGAPPFKLRAYRPREVDEQIALMRYAAIQTRADERWGLLFAITNGMAASSIQVAAQAKQAGLKRGVPDLFLPVAVAPWHGLFVEMKRADGKPSDLSPEQRAWLARLLANGYKTVVAYGWRAAVAEITAYFEGAS